MSYHSGADYSEVLPMFVLINMNKRLSVWWGMEERRHKEEIHMCLC